MKNSIPTWLLAIVLFGCAFKTNAQQTIYKFYTMPFFDANNWNAINFTIPDGQKLDSAYFGFHRPGYPASEDDCTFRYSGGNSTFSNDSASVSPFNYQNVNTSLYNYWYNLRAFNYTCTGSVQLSAPFSNGVILDSIMFAVSPIANIKLIAGNTAFCLGDSAVLQADSASNYLWSNGATTQSILVKSSGNYTAVVSTSHNCSATSNGINVNVSTPTATITGNNSFCVGDSTILTANTGSIYNWSNGNTAKSITVKNAGVYSVTVTNNLGCSISSAPLTVSISTPTATITGNNSFCAGDSTILTANTGSSYSWSNGATTQSISVKNSAAYSVTVTNNLGCSAGSNPLTVSVNALPTPTIYSTGCLSLCSNDSVQLSCSAANSFLWSNGATSQIINLKTPGVYHVTTTNSFGCKGISNDITITGKNAFVYDTITNTKFDTVVVHKIINDTVKTVVVVHDTITTHILDSIFVHINIQDTILVRDTLLYSVEDTLIIKVNLDSTANGVHTEFVNPIKVYPNPASDYVYINTGNYAAMNGYIIKIMNINSQVVFNKPINQQEFMIDLRTWQGKGTYILQIIDPQNKIVDTRKIILK